MSTMRVHVWLVFFRVRVDVQRASVKKGACAERPQHKSIQIHLLHTNDSFVQFITVCHSIVRAPRNHTPLDWNHCQWEKRADTLRGAAILKVSESLIFSRKSSRRIYSKWENGDGKWFASAGYSVITFIDRPRCPAISKLVVKWSPVALRGSLLLRLAKVQMKSTLGWAKLCEK